MCTETTREEKRREYHRARRRGRENTLRDAERTARSSADADESSYAFAFARLVRRKARVARSPIAVFAPVRITTPRASRARDHRAGEERVPGNQTTNGAASARDAREERVLARLRDGHAVDVAVAHADVRERGDVHLDDGAGGVEEATVRGGGVPDVDDDEVAGNNLSGVDGAGFAVANDDGASRGGGDGGAASPLPRFVPPRARCARVDGEEEEERARVDPRGAARLVPRPRDRPCRRRRGRRG